MKKLIPLVLSGIVVSCAQMGDKVDQSNFDNFENCKTTKDEIIAALGKPTNEGYQAGLKTMNWQFSRASFFGSEWQNSTVFLNKQGLLVDFVVNPTAGSTTYTPKDNCKK